MNMLSVAVAAAATSLLVPAIDFVSYCDTPSAISRCEVSSADVIVGDGDFNQVRPERPSDPTTERRNHTLRLRYVESLLRSRDVSDMPADLRAERLRNLDRLRDYWMRGDYPVNYEHPTAWEPCFIDREGAICAVGYLVEQSAGRKLAEKIDSRYHFATIKEIDAPELGEWIAHSGLTKAEVVTIQGPAMSPEEELAFQKEIARDRRRVARSSSARTTVAAAEIALTDRAQSSAKEPAVQTVTPEPAAQSAQPTSLTSTPADSTLPSIQ